MIDPDELLSLRSSRRGSAVVVTAVGEVDLLTAPRLLTSLRAALAVPDRGPVILDLTDVTFFSSAGLGVLVQADDAARNRAAADEAAEDEAGGGSPPTPLRVVVDHNRPVLTPVRIVGLGEVLALYDTVTDAAADREKPRSSTR